MYFGVHFSFHQVDTRCCIYQKPFIFLFTCKKAKTKLKSKRILGSLDHNPKNILKNYWWELKWTATYVTHTHTPYVHIHATRLCARAHTRTQSLSLHCCLFWREDGGTFSGVKMRVIHTRTHTRDTLVLTVAFSGVKMGLIIHTRTLHHCLFWCEDGGDLHTQTHDTLFVAVAFSGVKMGVICTHTHDTLVFTVAFSGVKMGGDFGRNIVLNKH